MRVTLEPYALRFTTPLITAAGTFALRRGWLVTVRGDDGALGVGDAAPLPGFSVDNYEQTEAELRAWDGGAALPTLPAARHAAEQALLTLRAAREGVSLASLLGPAPRASVPVARLVRSLDEADVAVAAGLRCLKLKVATHPIEDDVARVRALRERFGPDVALRLDANRGWSFEQAKRAIDALAPFAPELLEEPCLGGPQTLAALRGTIPLAADESMRDDADLERIIALSAVDVVVLKPMLIGGPQRAARLAERAHQAGFGVMISTALESGVGRVAALAVAAVNPSDLAAGLDTGHLFASDLGDFPTARDGALPVFAPRGSR